LGEKLQEISEMVWVGGRHSSFNGGGKERLVRFKIMSLRKEQEFMEEIGIEVSSGSELGSRFHDAVKMKVVLAQNFLRDLEVRVY
jgi:hypothetical protein